MNPFEGYRVSSPYGWRLHPVHKDRRFHTGIDLVKTHLSPIAAFASGAVTFAGPGQSGSGFGNYGNVVAILDHQGCLQCYCHLDSVKAKVGDLINKGQVIGFQGNTGIGTGSHLHFEVRKKSTPSYGFTTNAEIRAYEPVQYLVDYYKKAEPAPEKPPIKGKKTRYKDVAAGHWAEDAISELDKANIMDGYADGTFGIGKFVTREELAAVVAKLIKDVKL